MLPYLKPKGWPQLRKMSGVSKYGFSEDDDLIESALDEIIQAMETKNHAQLIEAIHALVRCIRNKESGNAESLKEA